MKTFHSGRAPLIPADVVATVLVLQPLNGLSDRDATETVTIDLHWAAPFGVAVTEMAFHHLTLTYGRQRVVGSGIPGRTLRAVVPVVASRGALAGKNAAGAGFDSPQ